MHPLTAQVSRNLVRSSVLLGGPVGAAIAVYYALWGPEPGSRPLAVASNVFLFLVFTAAFALLYRPRALRVVDAAVTAAAEHPSPETAMALSRLPLRLARSLFVAMILVAAVTTILNFASVRDPLESARVLVGLVLTAGVVTALGYLIAERSLRPVFAVGLGDLRGRTGAIGVRTRLLMAWAVGSAVPMLFIVAIPLGRGKGAELPSEVPMVFMATFGLIVGAVSTLVVAGSVADPLDQLRRAFDRLEAGDLDTSVPVDDPGEIGRLEAGFDRMVVSLRERRRLEDLFGRHVGVEVARQAMEAGVQLGGEQRDVSVFFVDVIGSTTMSEQRTAESVVRALNALFDAVARCASAEGGLINKFEGDAALVVFGAPLEQPDHADRCLRAARTLRAELEAIGTAFDLSAAIGVASGPVIAGNVGSEERYEYTVIGATVNEAARMTELAKASPGRLLATGSAVGRASEEQTAWRAAGATTLRGFSTPIETFTLSVG